MNNQDNSQSAVASASQVPEIIQIVNPQPTEIKNGRLPDGTFAPGNKICDKSSRGRGWQRPSLRLERLANELPASEIKQKVESPDFMNEDTVSVAVYKRLNSVIDGDDKAIEFLFDRIEGKATNKTELTGRDGGPIAIATADVSSILEDISESHKDD